MSTETNIANPYSALGVSRSVDDAELRRAYRAAVKRCHPDHGGDPAEFISVQEAYEALSDPVSRREVDALLDAPPQRIPTTNHGAANPTATATDPGPGPGRRAGERRQPRRRPDPTSLVRAWMEVRCLFECDIRGIGLDVLNQRHQAAEAAVAELRRNGRWDPIYTETLASWRERVAEIRAEILAETAPAAPGPRLLRGPRNRGLFTDRVLAVVAAVLLSAVLFAASSFGSGETAPELAIAGVVGAVLTAAALVWWVPTWVASWVRLGWGRRTIRAALGAGGFAIAAGASLWGDWVVWAGFVAAVAAAAAVCGFVADRRLAKSFPPPIWGPQRRVRALRERVAVAAQARAERRATPRR